MNKELWNKVVQFNLDNPPSEYGFSTRLANENFWTRDFTEQAILEYKKFMYLAATSEFMVSPSEIIDTVWHQHLIFTQSYQDFCNLIGKQIQHIPSTHNKVEFQKFKQAKERTIKFYSENFGDPPKSIWEFSDMYESLNLRKAKLKLRTFMIIGIFGFIVLTIPFYFILKPIYIRIDNPYFIFGFIVLTILTFIGLEIFNRIKIKQIINLFDKSSFIYNLHPFELVYLKTQKLSNVIHGVINELIDNKTIKVNSDKSVEVNMNTKGESIEQLHAIAVINDLDHAHYPTVLRHLTLKPVFGNTANCMNALKKYFNKSKKFGNVFYWNYGILSILLMLGFIRLSTGILREKQITQILFFEIILTIIIILYLIRLTKLVCTQSIPNLYKYEILPTRLVDRNWQWTYFLMGPAVLAPSLIPLVNYANMNYSSNNFSGCGTSCGSSCGSSCSSCGGCGGS